MRWCGMAHNQKRRRGNRLDGCACSSLASRHSVGGGGAGRNRECRGEQPLLCDTDIALRCANTQLGASRFTGNSALFRAASQYLL